MRKILCGAAAAACVGLAACTAAPPAAPPPPATATPAPATTTPADDGVTTATDVFGPGCAQLPAATLAAMSSRPVATAVASAPVLSELAGALGRVDGLVATLDTAQELTVLAPSDTAFAQARTTLGTARYTDLLSDQPALTDLVSRHIVGERLDAAQLVAAGAEPALAGGSLTFGGTAAAPTVTDATGRTAKVLCGNIPTANATVFVVDTVLLPRL